MKISSVLFFILSLCSAAFLAHGRGHARSDLPEGIPLLFSSTPEIQPRASAWRIRVFKVNVGKQTDHLYKNILEARNDLPRVQLASCYANVCYGKEVIPVKYEKPQLIVLPSAVESINSCESRKIAHVQEVNNCGNTGTTSAYEADE